MSWRQKDIANVPQVYSRLSSLNNQSLGVVSGGTSESHSRSSQGKKMMITVPLAFATATVVQERDAGRT